MKIKQLFIASIILGYIGFIALFAQSCSNESDTTEFTKEQKEIIKKYAIVGVEHNNAMSEIFNSLSKETKSAGIFGGNDLEKIVKQRTEKVLQDKFLYDQDLIDIDKFYIVNSDKTKSLNDNYINSVLYNDIRSEQFIKMMKELIRISDKYELSIKEHKNSVDELNKLAFSTLNEEELGFFLIGSSTACASFEYWHNHLQEWCALLGVKSTPRLKSGGENFWDPVNGDISNGMTGTDVGGAVAGAITGGVGGALAGGIGAGPGALLGGVVGGVGASTGQVVNNIGGYLGWW
jgi:hypothetical protein